MATAASLSIKLGLLTATFSQDTDKARSALDRLQQGAQSLGRQFTNLLGPLQQFSGLISGIGLLLLAQQTIALADSTFDLAEGFNLGADKVLQYKAALTAAGSDSSKFEQSLSKLFTAINRAQEGDELLIAKFQKLGISYKELSQLTPEAALNRVTRALADNANGFEKVSIARELFGRSAAGTDFKKLADELEKSREEAIKNAYNLSRLKNVHDDVKASVVNLQLAFASLIPSFASGAISVNTFEAALKALFVYFAVSRILAFAAAFTTLAIGIAGAATWAKALEFALSFGKLGVILSAIGVAVAAITFLLDKYVFTADKVKPPAEDEGLAKFKKDLAEQEAKRVEEAADKAKKLVRAEQVAADEKYNATLRQIALENGRQLILANIGLISERERKFIDINLESAKKLNDYDKQKADLESKFANKPDILKKELATVELLIAAENRRAELAQQTYDAELKNANAKNLRAKQEEIGFESGRPDFDNPRDRAKAQIEQKRQQEIRDKVRAPGEEGYDVNQQAIIDGINAIAAAELELIAVKEQRIRIQQLVTDEEAAGLSQLSKDLQVLGGKSQAAFLAFKAVAIAQTVIETYVAAQKQFAAFSSFPPLAYAAAGIAIAAGLARVAQIRAQQPAARQAGGPVSAGTPFVVGETGREIFVPAQSGAIIPNGKTEQMMKGGGATTFNITVNPGASFDEKVMQTILGNLKQLSGSLVDENQRRFSPSYSMAGV